jgi:hypothetical protein
VSWRSGEKQAICLYAVFLLFDGEALARGAIRSGAELVFAAALAMLTIPAASLVAGRAWQGSPSLFVVDVMAVSLAVLWPSRVGPPGGG